MRIFTQFVDWVTTPYTIYLILKDPNVPGSEKLKAIGMLLLIFVYIISPFDLIPDMIPLSGWLDDLLVVPLGFALARKLVPEIDIKEHRDRAESGVRRVLFLTIVSLAVAVVLGLAALGGIIYIIVRLIAG